MQKSAAGLLQLSPTYQELDLELRRMSWEGSQGLPHQVRPAALAGSTLPLKSLLDTWRWNINVFCLLSPSLTRDLAILCSTTLRVFLGETFSFTLWLPNPQWVD